MTDQVVVPTGTLPVPYDYGANAEKGFENTDQSDFLIPFLNLLQDLSDEVNKEDPSYIEGAQAGMFLNKATGDLYKEVVIVPVITQHHYVEWIPRDQGGGFVATYGIRDEVVTDAKRANGGKLVGLSTPQGNDLVDTFLIFALVLENVDAKEALGYVVIPFSITKIPAYKDITTKLRKLKGAPMFANRVLLTSFNDKNKKGQRYKNVKLVPAIDGDVFKSLLDPDSAVIEQGELLHEQVMNGMMQANFAAEGRTGNEETDEAFA